METEYIKLASYYVIFKDETDGCSVRYYDKDGDHIKHLYFSWEKCLDKDEFHKSLDDNLDPFHKWKLRPKIIKIYETDIGRTIAYYDKNDNLVYSFKYDGGSKLENILAYCIAHDHPIDVDYLRQTKNVIIKNDFDNVFKKYSKIANNYWSDMVNYFY